MHLSVLELALDRLQVEGESHVRCLAKQVRENLEHGLQAARTFLFDLRPPLLDREGLAPALGQQLGKLADRRAWSTDFTWDVAERLDQDLEVLVFRVVQEALANVARHAGAGTVGVRAWRTGPALEVEVADDGVGFDHAEARERARRTGHLGLRSMAERAVTAGSTAGGCWAEAGRAGSVRAGTVGAGSGRAGEGTKPTRDRAPRTSRRASSSATSNSRSDSTRSSAAQTASRTSDDASLRPRSTSER